MKFEQFIMALLIPVGLLLIAGGVAFQHFQNWAYLSPAHLDVSGTSSYNPTAYNASTYNTYYVSAQDSVESPPSSMRLVSNAYLSHQRPAAPPPQTPPAIEVAETEPTQTLPQIPYSSPLAATQAKPQPLAQSEVLKAEDIKVSEQAELVVYQDELVLVFPQDVASEQNIKRAVARVLLSPDPFHLQNLLKQTPIEYRQRPGLYRQVLDSQQQPIRYPRQAFNFAEYLMRHHQRHVEDESGRYVHVHIARVPSNLSDPARRFEPWVLKFADHFNVSPALVFAVMETESHFNPYAISRSNALGLMQIKPNAAGRDVYQYIDFRLDAPSDEVLFDAENNIRIGTAYLGLLKHDYFADIRSPEVREMIAISSYNGGLTTVWRLFGDTPEQAIAQINRMNPRQVYRTLRYEHASDETRRYLDKVLQAKQRYSALLGDDARLLAWR